ncbi:30S ribosomal protein S5 [Candidatus Woesearchaeota archaeon]|nr:30S ribosomal protein S5 [Candidatus Woesearchaeota archaeon]
MVEKKEETILEEEVIPAEAETGIKKTNMGGWNPKTEIGREIKSGKITNIDEVLDKGEKILEAEIVDFLLPNLDQSLLEVGQSKGKFGGGKRSIWRQTQKKTREGNKAKFATMVAVGNKDGYVGLGFGDAKETVPAREKAIRKSKLNIIKIRRGCGSWACGCKTPHSIPFEVEGKMGSSVVKLIPAPRGTGLCIQEECKKILQLAGITDVYSKARGKTATRLNLLKACFNALQKLSQVKIKHDQVEPRGIVEGSKK